MLVRLPHGFGTDALDRVDEQVAFDLTVGRVRLRSQVAAGAIR